MRNFPFLFLLMFFWVIVPVIELDRLRRIKDLYVFG